MAARDGTEAAVSPAAWTGFEKALRTYLRRRVDPAHLDDLVGDVLLRLVRHQASLAEADNPTAWLRRVAANAVADFYRRRGAEDRAMDQARLDLEIAAAEAPESTAAAEIAACLIPFIHDLPNPYRDALILTDIGGLRQAEAAQRLGISHSGMKSRVQRARSKLKARLLRCCAVQTDHRGAVVDYEQRAGDCGSGCQPSTRNNVVAAAGPKPECSQHLRNAGL